MTSDRWGTLATNWTASEGSIRAWTWEKADASAAVSTEGIMQQHSKRNIDCMEESLVIKSDVLLLDMGAKMHNFALIDKKFGDYFAKNVKMRDEIW